MNLNNVTLEMSLKPFKDASEKTARDVCEHLFTQWLPLVSRADMVSVLLWCADGSEILEYDGNMDTEFEWARYIGGANPKGPVAGDPEGIALHSRPYLYMDEPPVFTYGWLKNVVAIIKQVGREITGRPVRVGETFDPGPEFAKSPFKYEKHPEICLGEVMGWSSFVCAYATLNGDSEQYAGFADGIPEGTPLGTFFGRQCQHFLSDLGFDYLWLSNGFGFGLEPWSLRGAVFDGDSFSLDRIDEVREKTLAFWQLFRQECPDYPLETRGTNMSTGMDLSSDAVPLREIYAGGFGMDPPPNSPWAALNADFGLELIGWMSHIAEIPGQTFPFRFYTHDPWWLNSPWLDRYGREPHDIYLPMSVSRVDEAGEARTPTSILLLSVDDSYGNLPDQVPNEVIPHLLTGVRDAPDEPGPLTWVYPFEEYHNWTFDSPARVEEVFFGDWFMRGAVNNGLPLNTVMSTRSLRRVAQQAPEKLAGTILVSPVPEADSEWESALMEQAERGGKVLLYGPVGRAGERLLSLLGLALDEPLAGEFEVECDLAEDILTETQYGTRLAHHELLSAGGIRATEARAQAPQVVVRLHQATEERIGAVVAKGTEGGGAIGWVRGTVSCDPEQVGGHLLVPLEPDEYFPAEALIRYVAGALGTEVLIEKRDAAQPSPMLCIARHGNGHFLSGYNRDNTVRQHFRFEAGAPLLLGLHTELEAGRATYVMPPAWHRECRVFVEQEHDGHLSCNEQHSGAIGIKRRMRVEGLKNAIVRFFPEPGRQGGVQFLQNPQFPYMQGNFLEPTVCQSGRGTYLQAEGVSGTLLISW